MKYLLINYVSSNSIITTLEDTCEIKSEIEKISNFLQVEKSDIIEIFKFISNSESEKIELYYKCSDGTISKGI